MKSLMSVILAACVIAAAVPTIADARNRSGTYDGRRGGRDRSDDRGSYDNYAQELRQLAAWADRGYYEGMFSAKSTRNFNREASFLQSLLNAYYNNDRRLDWNERNYLDTRIGNLRGLMTSYYETAQRQQGRGGRSISDGRHRQN